MKYLPWKGTGTYGFTLVNASKVDNDHWILNPTRSEIDDYADGGTHSWSSKGSGGNFNLTGGTDFKEGDIIGIGWGTQTNSNMKTRVTKLSFTKDYELPASSGAPNNTYNIFKVGGGQPDTPTYFETLDKLDQWSSAQYIPDVRNSGDKLNL